MHGIVFGGRERHLEGLRPGDPLHLLAEPPGCDRQEVWVHVASGDPIGHLPPEISGWLCAWMRQGGHAEATVLRVSGGDTPSWRRVVVQVVCRAPSAEG